MAAPMMVPLTPGLIVADNFVIRITALDPTTGAVVSGVKVSQTAILGVDVSGTASADNVKPPATPNKSYFVGDEA